MKTPKTKTTIAAAAVLLAAVSLSAPADADRYAEYDYAAPVPGTYALPTLKTAADGLVLDEKGREHHLRDLLDGRITLLSFIYTRCADICPEATVLMHRIHGETLGDPELAQRVQLLSLSFDPEYDSPEVMAEHGDHARYMGRGTEKAGSAQPDAAPWYFLTTRGADALAPILAAYDQPVARKKDPDDPLGPLAHQLRLYLIDAEGGIRNIYSLGFMDPRLVLADVRTLLLEERREVAGR